MEGKHIDDMETMGLTSGERIGASLEHSNGHTSRRGDDQQE